jgi:hypothetical protein
VARFGGGAPVVRSRGTGQGGRGGSSPEERRDVEVAEERRHGSQTWLRQARHMHRSAEQRGRLQETRLNGARLGVKRVEVDRRG